MGSRIRVFDTMPRDVRDQCAGLGQDLGLLLVLEGAMTNSTYVSRFSFILIPYRFNVCDRFSAYTTCMVGIEHLSGDRKCWTKISDFFYSAIILVSDVRESSLRDG